MEKRRYVCKWGDWEDHALNAYDTREEEVSGNYFSDGNGYASEDINAIASLEVGEQYDVSSGNQTVTRIK